MAEDIKGLTTIDKVKDVFHGKEVFTAEEWEAFVDELKGAITEGVVEHREAIIKMKWQIGDVLISYEAKLSEEVVTRVISEIHISRTEIFRCLSFRRKFPTLDKLWENCPEGKNISWHKLVNNYIDFQVPKPILPVEEKYDDWGLIDWWMKNKVHVLRIKDRNTSFSLIVRQEKRKAEHVEPIKELFKEICALYIKLKKWDEKDISGENWNRMHRAVKTLLENAHGDKEKVKKAIRWCHEKYLGSQIDWTLETVIKKYPEAVRQVSPFEKYTKPKGDRR
jgi:hypothetical protein